MDEAMREEKTWYVCDPMKNLGCKKRSCVHNPEAIVWACDRTSNPAFAVLDENGEPMKAVKGELKLPVFRCAERLDRLSGKNAP